MFFKCNKRYKEGKNHRYWNIVENKRLSGGRVVQRQVLYLGEINDAQKNAWRKTIEVFEEDDKLPKQMLLFPEDKPLDEEESKAIRVKLNELNVSNARQWGACWLFCELWDLLRLDYFWQERLRPGRKGTRWLNVLKILIAYRLIDPGSEWRLHRMWYEQNAIGEMLGEDFGVVQKDKLYRCLDKLLEHKKELFSFLRDRWANLFEARYDILLYDLTSTYFECEVPERGKRKFGYSRDKRSDCVQVVIALVITPEGFPLAYEVMAGNTKDSCTLEEFLEKIENQYGKSNRTWMMDRGIPTEDTIKKMRKSESRIKYLIGTPKGKLTNLEKEFLDKPWEQARQDVRVKLLEEDGELYVLVESEGRTNKERSIRRRKLKKLWNRLKQLQSQNNSRDQLLLKIGAAKKEAGRVYSLVEVNLPEAKGKSADHGFSFSLRKEKLREVIKKEGKYLLRSNMVGA